jgi:glucosamine-6-phosphate deaminase
MTEVVVLRSREAAGMLVATAIAELVATKPDAVLGLATGSTPLPVYGALAALIRSRALDVSSVRTFALDEYVGLPDGHPQSYREVLRREAIEPIGLDPALCATPNGSVDDVRTAGREYEGALERAGGVDLQLLGIGVNGHIGFNEPGSSFASRTRLKTLTPETRRANARFFDSEDEVPVLCITQGLGTILSARHLVLLAFGEAKAVALAGAVEGPVTASNPASAIQLHPHVTVVTDEAAAARLAHLDYYRYAWENKPDWQGI